jgi:hypothetical protein
MMPLLGLLTLLAAAAFGGAAIYISLVEQPARLQLDDRALLEQWKPSYRRGFAIQASLALIGGLLGLITAVISGHWVWLAPGLLMLANWPFTLIAIMPTNRRLMAMTPQQAGPESRRLIERWGRLHAVRSTLGWLAALAAIASLSV